jgi:exonuclease III
MCIVLPKTLQKLSADGADNNGKRPRHPTATGCITAPRFPNVLLLSQNVRGYSSEQSSSKKDHIVRILKTFSDTPSILFTQETWSDNDTDLEIDNVLFFSHGATPNNRTKGGVGIILSPLATLAWKLAGQPPPIRPGKIAGATRAMALELHFRDNASKITKLFVISAYLPCSSYKNDEYENTLEELDKLMRQCPADATPVIGGDFNASIGTANATENLFNSPVGRHGNPHRNDSGEKLRDFMNLHGLCSIATFFEKRCHNTWSFNGDGPQQYQIDHILVPRKELRRFSDCDTIAGVESDHTAVAATMRIASFIPRKRKQNHRQADTQEDSTEPRTRKAAATPVDWEAIRLSNESVDEFNDALEERIDEELRNIDQTWHPEMECPYERLSNAMEEAARAVAPSNGARKRPPWFEMSENEIMRSIKNRDNAHTAHKVSHNEETRQALRLSRRELTATKATAKAKWLELKLSEIESINDDPRSAWKSIKEINAGFSGHHEKAVVMKMRKQDGTFATTETDNAKVLFDHFYKVVNRKELSAYDPTVLQEIDSRPTNTALDAPPTSKEIKAALQKMQYEKSPGKNGIPTEAFKSLKGASLSAFMKLIALFWQNDQFNPVDWQQIKLSILPKQGDLADPNKWRGIALGDIAAKCISSIVANRLTKYLSEFGIDEQCGSLFGKGCADATFTLKTALQTLREHNHEAHVLFVDLVKAYDTVNRELLWKILEKFGIPPQMIKVLQKLYTNVTYHMNVAGKKKAFESTCGVKQGDNLGPILFIFMIQAVSTTLDKKWDFETPDLRWHGMKADGSHKWNPNLGKGTSTKTEGTPFSFWKSYYVDDAAFLFLNRENIERASKLIMKHFKRFGLTVHSGNKRTNENSKTEAMHIPRPCQQSTVDDTKEIMLDDSRFFAYCTKFKYLGTTFTPELNDSNDVQLRIDQASKAFYAMNKNVFRRKEISSELRLRTYNAIIVNLLLWGCESWALKEEDRRRIEVFHHRSLRRMLNITIYQVMEQHISNKEVRERMKSYTMKQTMELRRARWLEKISHMGPDRGPRKILVAWTTNERPSGRPQQTIRHGLASTLTDHLNLPSPKMNDWIKLASDHRKWGEHVEVELGLAPTTYKPYAKRNDTSQTE